MTFRAIARRYAGALFDVAEKRGSLDRTAQELHDLRDLVASHRDLKALFESALVPPSTKRAVVEALNKAAPGLSGEVKRLLELLAERGRLQLLGDIAEVFDERLMEEKRIVRAEVVTATALDATTKDALAGALGRATGGQVELEERVDPEVIGGVTARIGSVVYDGSLATHLERLRQQLHQQ
jgi:F-type H+-transporting ATPase subunit delta